MTVDELDTPVVLCDLDALDRNLAAMPARCRELGIPFILVDYPGFESLDRHYAASLSPARQQLYRQVKDSIQEVQRQSRPVFKFADYKRSTEQLIMTLLDQGPNPLYLEQMARMGADAVGHGAAVAHLALLIAIKIEGYIVGQRSKLPANRAKDLVPLGVAAMLHDVGVTRLPESLWTFSEVTPPEDPDSLELWRTHPQLGYELVRSESDPTAAACILQHHQRFDGGGFPPIGENPLSGGRIHIFSRILYVANVWDRLAAPMKGARRSNHANLAILEERFATRCDPEVLRALKQVVPAYPPGTRLRLSDGRRVIVMEVDPFRPLKPLVRPVADDGLTPLDPLIDLSEPGAPLIALAE